MAQLSPTLITYLQNHQHIHFFFVCWCFIHQKLIEIYLQYSLLIYLVSYFFKLDKCDDFMFKKGVSHIQLFELLKRCKMIIFGKVLYRLQTYSTIYQFSSHFLMHTHAIVLCLFISLLVGNLYYLYHC